MPLTTTLTAGQIAFLNDLHYAVVGTLNANGTIQQTVVWYLVEDQQLRFGIGGNSTKARNLRRNPTITVTVAAGVRYLSIRGTAVLEPPDLDLRRRLVIRYRGPEHVEEWLARRPDAPRLSVRVLIEQVYGQQVT